MINLRRHTYLLAIGTAFLLTAAALCSLAENSMDIFFLGAGIFLSVITIMEYRKLREHSRARSS